MARSFRPKEDQGVSRNLVLSLLASLDLVLSAVEYRYQRLNIDAVHRISVVQMQYSIIWDHGWKTI